MNAWSIAVEPLWPYLVLIMIGFLPSEIWRLAAVLLSRGMREDSEVLVWVRAVATTLLAGVVVKLLGNPTGALALLSLEARFGALAAGLCGFYLARRSVLTGVLAGEATLVAVASWQMTAPY